MSLADLWPTFDRTEPPATSLWSALRAFADGLSDKTGGRVIARLDAVKLPKTPLGSTFELRLAASAKPSRAVAMLQITERPEGLFLARGGAEGTLVRTEKELIAFLETFASSPRIAEMVTVLGGQDPGQLDPLLSAIAVR